MKVKDQFGTVLPSPIAINEYFGTWKWDYNGEDWSKKYPPKADGTMSDRGAEFPDTYAFANQKANPKPVIPYKLGWNTKVMHANQRYRAGNLDPGIGEVINSHTLQFYRGAGRQE